MLKTRLRHLIAMICAVALPSAVEAQQVCRTDTEIPATTPDSRFVNHGDGTVTDTLTGLMWTRCTNGQSGTGCEIGSADTHTWQEALDLAETSEVAGYRDWRLPNIRELSSLVEEQCVDPAINLATFPGTPMQFSDFWTSSPSDNGTTTVWSVRFDNGQTYRRSRGSDYYVRLVRTGP